VAIGLGEGHEGTGRDIAALVAGMTLEEKTSLTVGVGNWHTAGIERLGVVPVKLTDGPNGARGVTGPDRLSQTASVCIPSGSALGATWAPDLVGLAAAVVARQAREKSARVLLAPTVNLHRHPLWGRNFECFSEDPFLTGQLASEYIAAVQGQGVIATVKHLVCNETEYERHMCSSEVDERTLRELYLLPFEMAVRMGGVQAVMTGYNRLNGGYVADNADLLEGVLREEWGFAGLVMTDWDALASTEEAAQAGLDLEMPGPGRAFGPVLAQAVREGRVPEKVVDAQVERLLGTFERFGALDDPADKPEGPVDRPEDRELLRRVAAEAVVLLTNDGLLPLAAEGLRRVALIGPCAARLSIMGGGSARVEAHYELSLVDVLRARLGAEVEVVFEPGCVLGRGADELGPSTLDGPAMVARAAAAAAAADVAIVVVGTNEYWESESYDRTDMDLPDGQAGLVLAVIEANDRTVVVINSGAPVTIPFADRAAALLQCWFGGQELAHALVDVLAGDVDPGGRLPVTLPQRLEHTPAYGNFPAESSTVRYGEGLLVGYRWYDARQWPPLFPFGHGLSYTTMRIGPCRLSADVLGPGGALMVEVDVENTGDRPGSEVVQLYVAPPGGGDRAPGGRLRAPKQLKGFAKVWLGPGEKTSVSFALNERSFAYYDVADSDWPVIVGRYGNAVPGSARLGLHRHRPGWYVDAGTYRIQVGRSSAQVPIGVAVQVQGGIAPLRADAPPG
jgi:beta-glucosidase